MFDKITLQVLANHCRAAAENMAYTLYRTAHSTFAKETEDFTVMVMDRTGRVVAVPMDLGATWYPGMNYNRAIDLVDEYRPGDIAFTNDPYSGYLATHAPDTHLWKPIFHEGEIVCFVGGHVHNTDMGGAVPASLSRSLTEIHQEGIRFPPMTLMRDGAQPVIAPEDAEFVAQALAMLPVRPWTGATWGEWTGAVKAATGRKGKGLFMPLRLALTGRDHGPELKNLLPLIGRERAEARLAGRVA